MGCGGTRVTNQKKIVLTGLEKQLEWWFERCELPEIDKLFQVFKKVIKALEAQREKIIDEKDIIYEQSGSFAYLEPNLLKSGICILWKLSADNEGNIKKAEIFSDDKKRPYIHVKGLKNSLESKRAFHSLISYLDNMDELENNLKQLEYEMASAAELSSDNIKDLKILMFDKFNTKPLTL
jgi:hypothetical protein